MMKQQTLALGLTSDLTIEPSIKPPVKIIRNYLNLAQQQALLAEAESYSFSRPELEIFGQRHTIPRSQIWFGDDGCDYLFSSLLITPQPMTNYLLKLRHKLERDFTQLFNAVLVNHYADGKQCVGWHSDDEPEIVTDSIIASLSLGASRDFFIRNNQNHQRLCYHLNSGDLLLMYPPMQQQWQHSLPKRLKVSTARINYTFRAMIKNYHQ